MDPDTRDWLPLSWLRAQRRLDLRPIVDTAQENTPFSVIQPTELPDPREFLLPGAVVLTVGVALVEEEDPFPSYVGRLADAGVTAIGFGTGLFFTGVPSALVDAARDHGIAVFEVPRHTAFISILNTVHEERTRRSRRDQDHLLLVQEELSASAVRGGLDELLSSAASSLEAAMAVSDNDGRLHGHHDHGGLSAAEVVGSFDTSGSSAEERDGRWRITQRMTPQGERHHLFTVLATHPLSPQDRAVVKHAAGLADILLQRPASLRNERTRVNALALRVLLGLDNDSTDALGTVLDQATDGDGLVRAVVVAADRAADLSRAVTELDQALDESGRSLFTTELDSGTRLFLFRGSRSVDSIAGAFGAFGSRVRIAVGEPVAWSDLSMERVQRLGTAARTLSAGTYVGPYEAGTDWLEQDAVKSALDVRASETVDRLSGEDPALPATLLTWLRSGGKVASTADALGVHRHTVRTRLDRIAGLLELDLNDPVVRAELLLVSVTRR